MESKKSLWLLLIVGAILIAVVVLVTLKPKKEGAHQADINKDKQPKIERTDIDATKIPDKIPASFPFEAGALITQNYTVVTDDGRSQATRVFETKKTLAENYTFYENYFKQNGWTIVSTLDQPQLKSIAATKDKILAQVTITENSVNKTRSVDVTITDAPVFGTAK